MEYNAYNNTEFVLFLIISFFIFLIVIIFLLTVWIPFLEELKYIKMEINRSKGREKRYWKRELKYHYLGLIPFSKFLFKKRK